MDKVQKSMNDLERRVEKSNKIVAKGEKMSLGDAIKLGRKSNSITATIKKSIKEYDVSIVPNSLQDAWLTTSRAPTQQKRKARKSSNK